MSCLICSLQFSSVQSLSRVRLFATPWIAAHQASLSITNSRSSLRLPSRCHPAISSSVVPFSSCPQSLPASGSFQMSQVASFSLHQVAKILEFQLQHQSFQWISRLISFRMDWLDLLAVQATLKSLLQHPVQKHNYLALSLFIIQLSHPYMATGKTIALTIWTFASKTLSVN